MKYRVKSNRIVKKLLLLVLISVVFIVSINVYINNYASDFLFDDIEALPKTSYGLVLGTSKYVIGGGKNPYFEARIESAAQLYKANKIGTIIVSGDNREANYNEPERMKQALMELGIPENDIVEEKEGYSTINSIKNFKKLYSGQRVTVITQRFHNERAVFLALKYDVEVVGYNAPDIGFLRDPKTHIREWFAKIKALLYV